MKNNQIILAVCTAIVLAVAGWIFYAYEYVTEEVDLGWSPEAERNDYLAAQLYLERQGIEATHYYSFGEIDNLAQIETLYIADINSQLSERQANALINWVESGGHLVFSGKTDDWEYGTNPLLTHLNIEIYNTYCECWDYRYGPDDVENESDEEHNDTGVEGGEDAESDRNPAIDNHASNDSSSELPSSDTYTKDDMDIDQDGDNNSEEDDEETIPIEDLVEPQYITELSFNSYEDTFKVLFNPNSAVYHASFDYDDVEEFDGDAPFYWTGTEWGTHFLQMDVGDGMVSVFSDQYLWQNYFISDFDNAFLLSVLTNKGMNTVFVSGISPPSFWSLLWHYGRELIIGSTLWIVLWLLYRSRRLVPARTVILTQRRSLAEHIYATGYFFWQRRQHEQLLSPLRSRIQARARMTIDNYQQLSEEQRLEAIAKHSGMALLAVNTALNTQTIKSEDQFTDIVALLQKLLLHFQKT